MNKAELLRSSDLGQSQADDTVAWLRTVQHVLNPRALLPDSLGFSTSPQGTHGQNGDNTFSSLVGQNGPSLSAEPRGHWLKYLGDDGLAVACAKHKVVYSHGRRVGGALRRALSQPGALPASCKAAVRTEATVPFF